MTSLSGKQDRITQQAHSRFHFISKSQQYFFIVLPYIIVTHTTSHKVINGNLIVFQIPFTICGGSLNFSSNSILKDSLGN